MMTLEICIGCVDFKAPSTSSLVDFLGYVGVNYRDVADLVNLDLGMLNNMVRVMDLISKDHRYLVEDKTLEFFYQQFDFSTRGVQMAQGMLENPTFLDKGKIKDRLAHLYEHASSAAKLAHDELKLYSRIENSGIAEEDCLGWLPPLYETSRRSAEIFDELGLPRVSVRPWVEAGKAAYLLSRKGSLEYRAFAIECFNRAKKILDSDEYKFGTFRRETQSHLARLERS